MKRNQITNDFYKTVIKFFDEELGNYGLKESDIVITSEKTVNFEKAGNADWLYTDYQSDNYDFENDTVEVTEFHNVQKSKGDPRKTLYVIPFDDFSVSVLW